MSKNTLTITDNRTGKTYEVPITDDTIRAKDLRQIRVNEGDFGMMSYDPAYGNTAACRSDITILKVRRVFYVIAGILFKTLQKKARFSR